MSHTVIVEYGLQRCKRCGKPHDCYRKEHDRPAAGITWTDPVDGHSYRSESWEKLARAYFAEYGPLPPLPPQ